MQTSQREPLHVTSKFYKLSILAMLLGSLKIEHWLLQKHTILKRRFILYNGFALLISSCPKVPSFVYGCCTRSRVYGRWPRACSKRGFGSKRIVLLLLFIIAGNVAVGTIRISIIIITIIIMVKMIINPHVFSTTFSSYLCKNNYCPQVWGIVVPRVGACLPPFRRFLSLWLGHVRSLLRSYCPSTAKNPTPNEMQENMQQHSMTYLWKWKNVQQNGVTFGWRRKKHVRQHSMAHLWNWNNESVNSGKAWRQCGSAPKLHNVQRRGMTYVWQKKNVQCVPWRTCGGPVKYTSSSVAWRVCESQKCTAP